MSKLMNMVSQARKLKKQSKNSILEETPTYELCFVYIYLSMKLVF